MPVTHTFVSPKAEQSDPTQVGPNEWNANHSGFFDFQTLTGSIDGNNNVFVVAKVLSGFMLFKNGLLQNPAIDYTSVTGGGNTTITLTTAPEVGATLQCLGN
jgi:hypothetical protein